jgi:drug/metabolite transporter (DMT)-like permease
MTTSAKAAGLTAIAAMIGSTLFYLLGDTAVKLAAETIPVPQIIVIRGAITAVLVALAAAAAGVLRHWRGMFSAAVFVRGGFDAATTLMFTNALANMRIADATAVINAAPIAGTLLAVVILKERVDALRWTAILLGFAGVLLVLQPDASGFNIYGLLALGAMITVAGREVVTRRIAAEVPSLVVTLWSALTVTTVGAGASLATGAWAPLPYAELGLISISALLLFGAYHTSVVSLRLGEVSLVGPFRYVIIVWGLVVGYLVWGDVPGVAELSGMALIALAGFAVFRRELARSRTRQS